MSEQDQPKKISPDQIEVVGSGVHAKPEDQNVGMGERSGEFRSVRVINAGPIGLLAIPLAFVFLPVLFVGLLVLLVLAAFFGRSVFKIIKFKR